MSSEKGLKRHGAGKHQGLAHTSPYAVSRLAPAHDLVDTAKQIAEADATISVSVNSKLQVIAEQIRHLQQQAREVLEDAQKNAQLHRAACNFKRKPGHTYHLYERDDGRRYLSLLSPEDWGAACPHRFIGSFRLEADMSWTAAGEQGPESFDELRALLSSQDQTQD